MNIWCCIHNLSFRYDCDWILQDVSFEIEKRDRVLWILGKSGIGKSTLLFLLAGFLRPEGGAIEIAGERIIGPSPRRTVVFQDHNLFPWMNVLDNIAFGLKCAGIGRDERNRQAKAWLDRVKLSDYAKHYPNELSGGMSQRVGIARALAVKPACILMDEPFNALDSVLRKELQTTLHQMLAETDTHAVIATHSMKDIDLIPGKSLILQGSGCASFL